MKPISPVYPKLKGIEEVVYGADQPEYIPLPAHRDSHGTVTSRWQLTWKERWQVFVGGNLWLSILTFNHSLQPCSLTTEPPEVVAHSIERNIERQRERDDRPQQPNRRHG